MGALDNVEEAADLLLEGLRRGTVIVVGDFDADGATASALLVAGLRAMGEFHVEFLVPDRFRDGYGLSPAIVARAATRDPSLIVTVDNGIAAHRGVRAAHDAGIPVLITDHHLPPDVLPDAACILNPNLPGADFPGRCLSGVGVAFYLLAETGRQLAERPGSDEKALRRTAADTLDLVALGTVADLVPLDHNNRVLVQQGLQRIRGGNGRPGIQALLRVAGRDTSHATTADLAFAVAPRLNAAGRMADMTVGIRTLLAESRDEAMALAQTLDALNRDRRRVQHRMTHEARGLIQALGGSLPDAVQQAACLYDPSWHEGVVGLVAGKIREMTGLPAFAFAPSGGGDLLKGSGRSVPGLNIRDVLAAIDATAPQLIHRFGGHAMAAGLTLSSKDLDTFRARLSAELSRHRDILDRPEIVWTDGSLETSDLGLELAELLRTAAPWGQSFPEPLFDDRFAVLRRRDLTGGHVKLDVSHLDGGQPMDALVFGGADECELREHTDVHLVYQLNVNEYRGRRRHQLVVEEFQTE